MTDLTPVQLPVTSIDFGNRLRQISEDHAKFLAQNIDEVARLRTPIEVRRKKGAHDHYVLIAGGHRLRAVTILGWETIPAFVLEMTDEEARLAEIDENLVRHELNPLDRAVFLAQRKDLYLKLYPETAAGVAGGKARQGSANEMISFAADTAAKCGLTERTIQTAVKIATNLSASVRDRVSGTWLAGKQGELLALCRLTEAEQHSVLNKLFTNEARTVEAARKIVQGVAEKQKSASDIYFEKLMAAWGRADASAQKRFLAEIGATIEVAE